MKGISDPACKFFSGCDRSVERKAMNKMCIRGPGLITARLDDDKQSPSISFRATS